ncbi:MmyB family transcriptional regulator [Streptomyces sp. 900105755]|uniref:MmyB family transcriptional regulator n=1 Tax=Streptomyces sp. Ag109_O5-10 TaxID=1855349 RepID=UPI00210B00A3|nr:hypothetical protein [Streptomyces sp. Ag109_O5-10]
MGPSHAPRRFLHPRFGTPELHCQTLVAPAQPLRLVICTATPGTGATPTCACSACSPAT